MRIDVTLGENLGDTPPESIVTGTPRGPAKVIAPVRVQTVESDRDVVDGRSTWNVRVNTDDAIVGKVDLAIKYSRGGRVGPRRRGDGAEIVRRATPGGGHRDWKGLAI